MSDTAEAVVLVTARSFGGARPELRAELEAAVGEVLWNELGRPLEPAELTGALDSVDGVIAGLDRFDAGVIESAPRLRVIARHGVGTDRIDLVAAARHGVVVTNTPGANSEAVAELAIGLMLALARSIPLADRKVRAGEYGALPGVELGGRTVGLLGIGRAGSGVARRAGALGCRVVAFDPGVDDDEIRRRGAVPLPRDEVVATSDFLSLHLPASEDTRDTVDAAFLAHMKRGAYLINTARGELVVERDLLAALADGRLAGAALDALRREPPPADDPLLACDDVILTPHSGADTEEARAAMGRMALDDLLAALRGEPPRHPVAAPAEGRGG